MTEGSNPQPLDVPHPNEAPQVSPSDLMPPVSAAPVELDPKVTAPNEATPIADLPSPVQTAPTASIPTATISSATVLVASPAPNISVTNVAKPAKSKLPLMLSGVGLLALAIGAVVYLKPFPLGTVEKKTSFYETEIQSNKELVSEMREEVEKLRQEKREMDSKLDNAQREFDLHSKEKAKVKAELDSFSFYRHAFTRLGSVVLVANTIQFSKVAPSLTRYACATIAFGFQDSPKTPPGVDLEMQAQKESLDQLREELKSLRDEKVKLETAKHEASRKIASLKQDMELAKKSIEDETQLLEEIRQFQGADFVVVDPELFVVGLVEDGDGYKLIGKASNSTAKLAGNAVKKWNKPIISTVPNLASQIHVLDREQFLTTVMKEKLDALWGSHEFFPATDGDKHQYVSFIDLDNNSQRLGYYLEHDENTLTAFTIDGKVETIKKIRVVPGSARVASGDKLIRTENDFQILDFCTCEIARLLSGDGDDVGFVKSVPPNVIVSVKIDLPESHKDVIGPWFGKLYSERYKTFDSLSKQLEDDLQVKLGKLNVQVLEREHLGTILGEQNLSREFGNEEILGQMTFATHVFICEVAESPNGTGYKVNVRLTDIRTSKQLWGESYDRPRTRLVENRRHDLSSGRLAVVNATKKRPEQWKPLREAKLSSRSGELDTQLLIMEKTSESTSDPGSISARNLFSMQIEGIPKKYIRNADSKLVKSADDVPPECMLQYLSWRIRQKTMPLAGLLSQVNESDDSAFVLMENAKTLVKRGDSVNIFRVNTAVETSNDSEVVNRLPLNATVLEVQNGGFRISTEASDVMLLWTGSEGLVAGDLVCPPSQTEETKFLVQGIKVIPPPRDIYKKLGLHIPIQERKLFAVTQNVGGKFAKDLQAILGQAELAMLPMPTPIPRGAEPKETSATHVITGEIYPMSKQNYRVRLFLTDSKNGEQVMSEEFTLRKNFVIQER